MKERKKLCPKGSIKWEDNIKTDIIGCVTHTVYD